MHRDCAADGSSSVADRCPALLRSVDNMLEKLFTNSALPALQQVVAFTEARQGVLAGNVANVHTPGYRTRDLSVESFQQALKKQIEADRLGDIQSPGHP